MPPGWYEDPWHAPGLRWWDGHQWTAHTVVPVGQPPPPPPPAAPPPPPARTTRRPPLWVVLLAVLGLAVPVGAVAALIVFGTGSSESDRDAGVVVSTPTTATPTTPSPTPYRPPHTLRSGPAAPGEPLTVQTRDGVVRVAVVDVIDPVPRGGYYRGPRSGTRWVGVRLRITNAGTRPYEDDIANDVRLVAGDRVIDSDTALLSTCDVFPVQIVLAAGESRAGCVVFETPSGDRPRQLRFASNSYYGPELATFTLGR
jgi:Protein of unknown function (DUF2510)